jgi:hypothetical protein
VQAPARAWLPAGGLRGGRRARRRVSSRPGLHEAADAAAHVPVLRLPVAGHGDGGVSGPPPGDRVPPVPLQETAKSTRVQITYESPLVSYVIYEGQCKRS